MPDYIDPIELLTNKGDRQPTFLNDKWNPLSGAVGGFCLGMLLNWGFRKPILSGIQKHIGLSALGLVIGRYVDEARNEYLATRDAVLKHYVELHPEDFPAKERVKYGDVIEPWFPIR